MREWRGGNSAAFNKDQRHAADAISTQLYELTAATRLLSGNLKPSQRIITIVATSDHGALLGLADDDHAQYLQLGGRTAGQTLSSNNSATTVLSMFGAVGQPQGKFLKVLNSGSTARSDLGAATLDLTDVTATTALALSADTISHTNGSGTAILKVTAGKVRLGSTGGVVALETQNVPSSAGAMITTTSQNALATPIRVNAFSAQTGNLTEWRDSSNNVMSYIRGTDGAFVGTASVSGLIPPIDITQISATGALPLLTIDNVNGDNNSVLQIFRGSTLGGGPGQTANFTEWRDGGGTLLSRVTNVGAWDGPITIGTLTSPVLITGAADDVKLTLKGHTTQTHNLLELKDSTNAVTSSMDNAGGLVNQSVTTNSVDVAGQWFIGQFGMQDLMGLKSTISGNASQLNMVNVGNVQDYAFGAVGGTIAMTHGTSFRFENRTSDPGAPVAGQVWLRTDL